MSPLELFHFTLRIYILLFPEFFFRPPINRNVIHRQRASMQDIFRQLGPYYVWRSHRMTEDSFWNLHRLLRPFLIQPNPNRGQRRKKHKNGAHNGLVLSCMRLSMALRVFAGGDPLDIALVHGVSVRVVHYSVARVVNAINACPSLNINFPTHQQQLQIANEFKLKSNAGFSNCVGCIDGILIWIQKPTWHEALDANIGQQKFLCGRKKKCGFNMQAVCDHHGRFIDTDVSHPGATSD